MENSTLPIIQEAPSLHVNGGFKGTAKQLNFSTSTVAGAARVLVKTKKNCQKDYDS